MKGELCFISLSEGEPTATVGVMMEGGRRRLVKYAWRSQFNRAPLPDFWLGLVLDEAKQAIQGHLP